MKKLALAVLPLVLAGCSGRQAAVVETFPFEDITFCGQLEARIERSLDRLQEGIYQPPQVFKDDTWPGDFVGRTILGVTLDARASHSQPLYLKEIINELPNHLNSKGYLGPIYGGKINEQQLSGHGWLLRGLCEYYEWTGDESVVPIVKSITDSLFLPGKGRYSSYPISPDERSNAGGGESGAIVSESSDWMLSTDVGCLFIGMAGLIDSYELLKEPAVKETVDEMISRFLQIDLKGIQAQTHATLSALRGILKYYRLTGEASLLEAAKERWDLYENHGMTCNYENYNWFGRQDSWTEPCAIVDSYMVAFDLWKETLDPRYRNIAELIAFNAIGHTQRFNGGFGCDNCPSMDDPFLCVHAPEAYWCCTMRGAEGLSRIAESSWARKGNRLYVPIFVESALDDGRLSVSESTAYPSDSQVELVFKKNDSKVSSLLFPDLPWADSVEVKVNGAPVETVVENGFRKVSRKFAAGDEIRVSFSMPFRRDSWNGKTRFFRGPLMLGLDTEDAVSADSVTIETLSPVCHLMDSSVWNSSYKKQVLF